MWMSLLGTVIVTAIFVTIASATWRKEDGTRGPRRRR